MLRRDPGQSVSFRDNFNRGGLFSSRGPIFLATMLTMMLVGAPRLAFGQNPGITVTPTSASLTIPETDEDATGTYQVELATQPSGTVTVRITGESGDVTVNPDRLEFTTDTWDDRQTVTVTVAPDDDAITDPPVTLRHAASGANYGGVTRDVTVNITEDDPRGVTVAPTELTVEEGDSEEYTIKLDSEPSGPVTVRVGGATGEVDVEPSSLTFTTGNWDDERDVTVSLGQDDDAVADGTVTLTHTVSGADYDSGVTVDSVTVTLTDDDTPALRVTPTELAIREGSSRDYRVRLATQPTGEVTVMVGGVTGDVEVHPPTLTFTTGNWNRNQTVRVSVGEDPDAQNDDDVTLTNTAAGGGYGGVTGDEVTVTITDNDTPAVRVSPTSLTIPEGSNRTYTVTLATEPSANVTVAVSGASGDVTVQPGSLTLTSTNWNDAAANTITVSAGEDDDAAKDDSVTLTHEVTGADEYDGLDAADVTVNVTENDQRSVILSEMSLAIDEGASLNYTIRLDTLPTGDVKITIGGLAGDVSVDETTLTFTTDNWNETQTVTVSAAADDDAVKDAAVTLTHTVSGADYQGVTAAAVTVTINELNTRGVTLAGATNNELTVREGMTGTYTLVLDSEPSSTVTITVRGATGDVSVDSSTRTLRFTTGNWDQPQPVRVNARQDDDAVDDDPVTLTHTVRGGDYSNLTDAEIEALDVEVTIAEDDVPGVEAAPSDIEIVEGRSADYYVTLTSRPSETVTVEVTGATSSVTVDREELTFSPSGWNRSQRVRVTAADDAGDTSASLSHTANGGDYNNVTGGRVEVSVKDSGTVGVVVNPTALTVEEGRSTNYTVVLTSQPTERVTVAVGGAPEDGSVTVSPDEFTFTTSNWSRARTVTVRANQDDDDQPEDVTLTHTLTSDDSSYNGANASDVEVMVMDNDRPGVRINPTRLTIPEGSSRTYTVELMTQPTGQVTIEVTPGAGDVTVSGTTLDNNNELTFTQDNWNTEQTVTVTAVEDTDSDDDEVTIAHTAQGGGYQDVVAPSVMVTTRDDDRPGVKISPTSLEIPEGQSRAYSVVLGTVPSETVTVTVGDASGDDITVDPKTLVFSVDNWNMEQTVTVTAEEDGDAADDADVTVTHSVSGGDYNNLRVDSVTVTIVENDLPAVTVNPTELIIDEGKSDTYAVMLTTQPTTTVTVAVVGASGDVSVEPSSLTFDSENWEEEQEVTVTVAEDGDALPDASVTLFHRVSGGEYEGVLASAVTVNINETDDRSVKIDPISLDVPEGESKTYTVVLTSQPTATVTVDISGASGDVSVNRTRLTYTTRNWHQEQTVTVSAAEDDDAESDTPVTLQHRVRGGDYSTVSASSVTVTIAENDSRGVTIAPTELQVPEDGEREYTVVLTSQPTGDLTIEVGGAANNVSVSPDMLKFTTSNWDRAQTVEVSAADDGDTNTDNETVTLTHTSTGGGYEGVTLSSVSVTVVDNDVAGVAVSPTALDVDEGGSARYTVVLTKQPSATVTIDVGGAAGDVTVSPTRWTFSTSSWNRARTVTVRAADDLDAQTDSAVTLTHTVTGGDDYQGVTASAVTVTIMENDTKGVIVTPTEMTIPAGISQAYTVALNSEPTADVTVTVKGATLEVTTDPARLMFTTDNWRRTQSVTVSVDEDFKVADEEAVVELTHTVSGGDYTDVDAPGVKVTVPVTGAPSAPTGLAVEPGNQSATLTWGAPADDGGSPIQSYQYRHQAAGGTYTSWTTASGRANARSTTITGLTNGTTYNFEVRAVNATAPGRVASISTTLPESEPGAPTGLRATAGNGRITLSWNAPSDGGSSILRYEYRYASEGGTGYGEWMEVDGGASTTSVTISGLTNGVEHAFQVRAENAIGEGDFATVNETPGAVPGAVALAARGGNGAVTLMWDAPADDGGAPILSYDVRYRESGVSWGAWMEVDGAANARTTIIMDLTNGTTYEFQVRAVNGKGDGAAATIESTPMPGLDFAHFANGMQEGGVTITSDIVLVNVETSTVYPAVFFYNQKGEQLDADMVVDMSADLMVTEDGGVTPAMGLEGRGEITISTHGRGALVIGSAKVFSDGRIGGVLRFDIPAIGVAGVGASEPASDVIFPARRTAGGINTGAAIRNLGSEPLTVTCHLMQGGEVMDTATGVLVGDGQISMFIDEMFPGSNTADFVGSVRCMAPDGGMFTGVALEMDSVGQIFTTLPMVPLNTGADNGESMLNFAHFANGDFGGGVPTSSDLVFINVANSAVSPAIYFYDQDGNMIDASMIVDPMMDGVDVGRGGALMVMDEIPPMGEMTISTSGMGDGMVGSVRVVSDGPIGGVLRFDIPTVGVAGVGASEAVNAAIFPARYMEGGINTGAAIRNLESEKMMVTCKLMQGGRMVDEEDIPLAANAQNSQFITEVFDEIMDSGMSEFVGSVHCSAPEGMMFTGVALEMDFINRVFTTLPVVPVQ